MPLRLTSFDRPVNAVVIGAAGGLGSAFVAVLAASPNVESVFALSRDPDRLVPPPGVSTWRAGAIDFDNERSIQAAANDCGQIDLVIVATGALHCERFTPEKSWRALDADALHWSYHANAVVPALAAKHFLEHLPRSGKAVFAALSARVGSISDNQLGGWYGYRAAKAALNQIIKSLSIEMARRNPEAVIVGLHPGTVDTKLSKPFQAGVAKEKLFSPTYSAHALLTMLEGLDAGASGRCFDWQGLDVPP